MLALIFVAVPFSWMDAINLRLGLGNLPDEPIVGYLARSLSAFWALLGGLFWVVSFHLGRYRQVLIYLGCAVTFLGVVLLSIDWSVGMPLFWKIWEGPFLIVFGLVLLRLSREIESKGYEKEALHE